ncbi:MFS transporter [Mycolicibacterium sp. CBM1]
MKQQAQVTGLAAAMTTVAMALGSAVAVGDLRILAANISIVRNGLQFSPGTTIFVSSLATLTLAASVLAAGVLGDKYGMRRMFVAGACAAVVFGLVGAAAPNVAVLMIARACIGVAFAFLTGLSLAIMNAVFPPERRAGAIASYLAAVYAFGVVPATVGSLLAEHIGWRSGFLVTPVLAGLVLVLTLRYVPETRRSHRRTDIPGLLLVATALIGVTYGISVLQNGLTVATLAPILAGILAAAAFVWWELRCSDPALDLRIFRSPRFNAVVTAGAASNLVQGGSMVMITFYSVLIRGQSTWAFALLLIPATLLSALAALVAGRATTRFGSRAVVVAGLAVLAVSLLVRTSFTIDTPMLVVGAVVALTTIGGAIVQTPQTTVMMSSAPTNLGGVVSAVKASVGGTFYGMGSALFSMFGILLFIRDAEPKLAGSGISARQAGDILGATGNATGGVTLDPDRTAWVISQATSSMLDAADTLNVMMAVIPLTAIAITLALFRPKRDTRPVSDRV